MTANEKLALRVNELFHDIEGKEYQNKHADIFSGEYDRWKSASKKYFSDYQSSFTVIDIGTGTGFIPLATAEFLSPDDTFICSDISKEMLSVAKKNIAAKNFQCQFVFLKLDGKKIALENENLSIIMMNSVLHHIPNLEQFCGQLNQLLKPGGRIIIGHEPNKYFYQNKLLLNLFLFLQSFTSIKKMSLSIARFTRISILLKKFLRKQQSNHAESINKILLQEGLLEKELTEVEINKMVDYHSPSAGSGIDKSKGIDINELKNSYLPDFSIEYFETYNFISKLSNRNEIFRKINDTLSRKYKDRGATFFAVFKKRK